MINSRGSSPDPEDIVNAEAEEQEKYGEHLLKQFLFFKPDKRDQCNEQAQSDHAWMRQYQSIKVQVAFSDLQPDGDEDKYREQHQQPIEQQVILIEEIM